MPTKEQCEELEKYTKSKYTSINDVWGWLLTAKNGKSIFLPAAGYYRECSIFGEGSLARYWSRSLLSNIDEPQVAGSISFESYDMDGYDGSDFRDTGCSVRPVRP